MRSRTVHVNQNAAPTQLPPQRSRPAALLLIVLLAIASALGSVLEIGAASSIASTLSQNATEQQPAGQPPAARLLAGKIAFGLSDGATSLPLFAPRLAAPVFTLIRTAYAPSQRPPIAFARIRDGLTRAPPLA